MNKEEIFNKIYETLCVELKYQKEIGREDYMGMTKAIAEIADEYATLRAYQALDEAAKSESLPFSEWERIIKLKEKY